MKVELLAPAGSFEAMEAAVRAGADAVYLGGQKFGARAYADNFDQEQMIQAIQFAHLHHKKLYLTVNTLLKNREMEKELYDYLAPYYDAGMDAVIVQDLGVLKFIKKYFPHMHIHASTQMTITGVESAKLLVDAGASRIVTARELSLEEIRKIYDATGVEIESFIHGALCYCYSGQCLMSSLIGGRSGNRGRCAQPCRLPYEVYKEGRRLNDEKTSYPLSPKDMCTVDLLPEIIGAGVRSLKIEGRMKKPEYTAGVVEIYRKYLDLYLEGQPSPVTKEDYQTLMDLYNRDGFHQSYYKVRNGRSMMALKNEKQEISREKKGGKIKPVMNSRNEKLFAGIRQRYLEGKYQEKINGNLSLFSDCPAILSVDYGSYHVTVEGDGVQTAQSRPMEEEKIRKQMLKTGDTEFVFDTLDIYMGDDIFIPVSKLNNLRRKALEELRDQILSGSQRKDRVEKTPEGRCVPEREEEPFYLSASVRTEEQLYAVLKNRGISKIYADCGIFPVEGFYESVTCMRKKAEEEGKELYLMLPHMVRDRELNGRREQFSRLVQEGLSGFLVRNMESFGILKSLGLASRAVLDANVYTMNDRSREFWKEQGVCRDTVPLELNQKELGYRENHKSEMIVYGYAPMMVSVQCVQKNLEGCNHKNAVLTLRDRYQKEFHAVCSCEFCYNTIYNSLPLSLLKDRDRIRELGVCGARLSFTMEDRGMTERVADAFVKVYGDGEEALENLLSVETTRGHFGRGVE